MRLWCLRCGGVAAPTLRGPACDPGVRCHVRRCRGDDTGFFTRTERTLCRAAGITQRARIQVRAGHLTGECRTLPPCTRKK